MGFKAKRYYVASGILAIGLAACSADEAAHPHDHEVVTSQAAVGNISRLINSFDDGVLVEPPQEVACKLSGGTETTCLSYTLDAAAPPSFTVGPWCPSNISDGPEMSGIWLEDGEVFDADGAFIQNLATFYKDDFWQMYDPETGEINVTKTKASCAAAARPDVDPQYYNHCVECQVSFLDEGLTQTYVIPITPVKAARIEPRVSHGGVGVAFSGVRLDASAPTDAILGAHTLAPFDDCGGHVNLNAGYHLHAVTDCLSEVSRLDGHPGQIGIAMDGYAIHMRLNDDGTEPTDLDQCRGHSVDGIGYHYHVNEAGKNAIIGCHTGETGCALSDASATCDASQSGRRGPPPGRE